MTGTALIVVEQKALVGTRTPRHIEPPRDPTSIRLAHLPRRVLLRFEDCEPEFAVGRAIEAKALDAEDHQPILSLGIRPMSVWLKANGYRCVLGSNGVWVR